MKLKYHTGIATLIQFITLTFLGMANGLNSIISTCRHQSNDCAENIMLSIIFFIITAAWFGGIWILGYVAHDRRSKRLAQLLILAECGIGLIALFNAMHHTDLLGLVTSIVDLALVLWVILLAFQLIRGTGKGGSYAHKGANSGRARRRRTG